MSANLNGNLMLGVQLRELFSGLSDNGSQHLSEVERDLLQTTYLLGEAIEKLGTSFMGIHAAVCRQQQAVDDLLAQHPLSPDVAEQFRAVQGEIGSHVNSAVTSLQFQDMTSQLIDRTMRRVSGVKDVLGTVAPSGIGAMPESDAREICALLEQINRKLAEHSAKLEGMLRKSVAQTHMDSGDIELF